MWLLNYDFSHNISVGLFHDKKCYNCINLFPCIFVRFICNGFSIKWWRFDQDNWKSHNKHMQEGEQSGQVSSSVQPFQEVNSRLGFATCTSRERPVMFPYLTENCDFSYSHHLYYITLITHRNGKEPIERKILRKVSTTHPPY